ncbi:unnamed protein product [Cylicocyclus nassatus]|uniref:Leishmanolysin-like peptidase n=1 Tax=Cylicocyclus nassatus TaxID=53992 RepID=A0AA36GMS8_CYLNA|nr:unnamed protein product [Cylicocyclus nassatus]
MLLLVIFNVLATLALSQYCKHMPLSDDELVGATVEYEHPQTHNRTKRAASDIWDWIRIETEYDASVDILPEDKQEILEDLITTARDYFESTLKVHRLSSLQLNPSCSGGGFIEHDGTYRCNDDCEKRCGGAVASVHARYFKKCTCGNKDCRTKQGNWGGKLRNADFILFVMAKVDGCGENTLAFASHCSLDPPSNRNSANYVKPIPYEGARGRKFKEMGYADLYQWQAVVKHELIHAFVFSKGLYGKYIHATNETRKYEHHVPGVIERFTRNNWECSTGTISHDVYMMVTPKVKEEAQMHFKCEDLEGAEVESQGGPGTAGSHWEKRVFENEAMSGVATQVYAVSRLTLALFEDSGWYTVNYSKADKMEWGYRMGCEFAKRSCLSWMKRNRNNPYPFCIELQDTRCSTDRKAKVRCSLVEREQDIANNIHDVEKDYNYNIMNLYKDKKNRSVYGFGPSLADYCPYYRVYGEFSVMDNGFDTRCTFPGNMYYSNYSLEIFSPTARCFQLRGPITVIHEHGGDQWLNTVGCFETKCDNNLLYIKTQNSKFYPCYHGGQTIHVEKRVYGVGTVKMKIICPSCTELCGKEFCAPDDFTSRWVGDPSRKDASSYSLYAAIVLFVFMYILP